MQYFTSPVCCGAPRCCSKIELSCWVSLSILSLLKIKIYFPFFLIFVCGPAIWSHKAAMRHTNKKTCKYYQFVEL